MANLTITIDGQTLKRARIRALEQGTSVNALVADYLTSYADLDDATTAIGSFLERARRSNASSGPEGRVWRREDLYDL